MTRGHLLAVPAAYRPVTALQAVRIDANGDKYSRSATGLGATNFSFCGWVKLGADRNQYTSIVSVGDSTEYVYIGTFSDGTTLRFITSTGEANLVAMTVGTWYFFGLGWTSAGGTNNDLYWAAQGAGSLSTSTVGAGASIVDSGTLQIGDNMFNIWANTSIAQVRVWSTLLNSTEMNAEFHSSSPVKTANLWAAYSFASGPQTTDDSGNGRTLTAGGTLTADTSGPTIT